MLPMRAVLVESDEAVRDHLHKRLHRMGYSVTLAHDSSKALDLLDNGDKFHLLMVDANIEGAMDGWDLAQVCRARYPQMGLLMTLGRNASRTDWERAGNLNFPVLRRMLPSDDSMEKPRSRRQA